MTRRDGPYILHLQLLIAAGFMVEGIDGTMITTALPAIAKGLQVDPMRMRSAISSYYVAMAVFVPLSGWCAERFGLRSTFCWAIVVFTIGSATCAFAPSFDWFVAARALQGVGAALIFPTGRLVLLRILTKEELVRGLAFIALPVQIGPMMGPVVGGLVTTYFDWGWLFLINVPLGLVGIVVTCRLMRGERRVACPLFDSPGFALLGVGLGCLAIGLDATFGAAWSTLLVAAGVALLLGYWRHACRESAPLLATASLESRTFRVCLMSGFLFRAGMAAFGFMLPIMLQTTFGLTPLGSGALTFFAALGTLSTRLSIVSILRQAGFRRVLILNAVVCWGAAASIAALTPLTPRIVIVLLIVATGFFGAVQIISLDTLAFADIPEAAIAGASTLTSVTKQFSPAVGVACAGLALQAKELLDRGALPGDLAMVLFLCVSPLALTSFLNMRLPGGIGGAMSGHVER